MKKIIVILVAIFATNVAIAQVNFGFRAGYNAATVNSSDAEITEDGKVLSGLNIGALMNVKLNVVYRNNRYFMSSSILCISSSHVDSVYINIRN